MKMRAKEDQMRVMKYKTHSHGRLWRWWMRAKNWWLSQRSPGGPFFGW
jgi:hypothetical protein